jgi:hypothetical protein
VARSAKAISKVGHRMLKAELLIRLHALGLRAGWCWRSALKRGLCKAIDTVEGSAIDHSNISVRFSVRSKA